MQVTALKAVIPAGALTATMAVGRTSSFEVTVSAASGAPKFLAYSKLAKGVFPDYKAIAAEVLAFSEGKGVPATWIPADK